MAPWLWILLATIIVIPLSLTILFVVAQIHYRKMLVDKIVRIFEEKPLFVVPKGKPIPDAEEVDFPSKDGTMLRGCYMRSNSTKGVILFGLEFSSNRWSAHAYCSELLAAGYDVFTYEPRNHGDSSKDPNYKPLQWVTDKDLLDARAARDWLKQRLAPDQGYGYLGISKGGSVGMVLAAEDADLHCIVTDGAYATCTTMVPYMRRWVDIYVKGYKELRRKLVPDLFYQLLALAAIRRSAKANQVDFLHVEQALKKLRQPLLMIHGQADAYIQTPMAEALHRLARSSPKQLWLVPKAKHNQSLHTAGEEYHQRLVAFFDTHLRQHQADA